jgi:hypothetical protein
MKVSFIPPELLHPSRTHRQLGGFSPSGSIAGVKSSELILMGVERTDSSIPVGPTTIDYPSAGFSSANGINSRGEIVGSYQISNQTGFLYSDGMFTSTAVQNAGGPTESE